MIVKSTIRWSCGRYRIGRHVNVVHLYEVLYNISLIIYVHLKFNKYHLNSVSGALQLENINTPKQIYYHTAYSDCNLQIFRSFNYVRIKVRKNVIKMRSSHMRDLNIYLPIICMVIHMEIDDEGNYKAKMN